MNKSILSFAILLIAKITIAQVGVNTENPQQILHVDGANDNPLIGTPNSSQQANDFVVTQNGSIGVGTTTPSTNLHINSSSNPAFRLVDGTQAEGKILTSDANGNTRWDRNFVPRIVGTLGSGRTLPFADDPNYYHIGSTIILPSGRWAVTVLSLLAPQGATTPNDWMWVRSTFSDSPTTAVRTADIASTPQLISGAVHGPVPYHLITGTVVINNNGTTSKTYYYIVGDTDASSNLPPASNFVLNIGGGWGENIIYAMPID